MKKNEGKILRIIIVGCGKVGTSITEQLSREGHDITIVDKNASKVQALAEMYDVMGIVGNGASFSVQMEAGIEKADLIIAVTDSDELNLLCCTVARKVGECAGIARVSSPDYRDDVNYLREKLGLALIISPELEAAIEISRIIALPTALDVNTFAHGQAEIIKICVIQNGHFCGKSVAQLTSELDVKILICAVERGEDVFIPSGDFVFEAGDHVSFVASRTNARIFLRKIGFRTNHAKNALIVGGGKVAFYLAKQLINAGAEVKIIEKDKARCEELSVSLPKAVIINGDGTEGDILAEEGIENAQAFIPLTGIDEENVMLSLYAKQVSDAKIVTKINRLTFKNVINSLDLGSVIYPRYITTEAIIAYVRAKKNSTSSNIETLYHMFDSRVEAIEFRVDESSEVTDKPLMELSLRKHLLVCFINRKGKIFIPSGQDYIKAGDTVMVVTTHSGFNDISDILKK